eukprot:CAMPEP_0119039360 /NCGR_PEP_ID=MMETSP1177-20130426/8777_1 /TAXON_ID=2985 /ORGANISM="Ochromonas sp, Strain CCMP1899" /LENGTH=240 /DNA_ID=CAMNT_0007003097 /DNA_START=36 /DNA_END=755 /DNA_ORIENTATION=-
MSEIHGVNIRENTSVVHTYIKDMDQDGDVVMLIDDSEEAVTRVDRTDHHKTEDRELTNGIFDNWRIYNDTETAETEKGRYIVTDKLVDIQPLLSELVPSFPGEVEGIKITYKDSRAINDTMIAETENESEGNGVQLLSSLVQQLPCDSDSDFELRTDIENYVVLDDAKIHIPTPSSISQIINPTSINSSSTNSDGHPSEKNYNHAKMMIFPGHDSTVGSHTNGTSSPHEMVVDDSYDYND